MVKIELVKISNFILKNVTLTIENGSIHVVIGPNGAGKTTLLKVVAGLIRYKGHIYFNGKKADNMPPWKRNIGYLPQTNALFPHMTVLENILFGLKNKGLSRNEAYGIAKYYMELLGISHLKDRYPLKLSGGEQKKVALARALAVEPQILLLDEPFTGLHYDYRVFIYNVIKKVHVERKPTIILVTHEIDEALKLGEKYTILVNGVNKYSGGLKGFFENANKYLPYINAYKCSIIGVDYENGLCRVKCRDFELIAPLTSNCSGKVIVSIPSDKIIIHRFSACYPKTNCISGVVEEIVNEHGLEQAVVKVGDTNVNVLAYGLRVGDRVMMKFPVKDIKIFCIS